MALTIRVIDSTPHELVVLKPARLACELPRDPGGDSLVRRLEHRGCGGLRLVHRLDAPACGVLVIARTSEAAAHYASEIEARRWHKWYVARVAAPDAAATRLLGKHKAYLRTEGAVARVVRSGGKPSFLDVVCAAPASGGHADLLIRLHTGRFHQIRAMLSHLGAPLAGDRRYGGPATAELYLEHVMLAARPPGDSGWRIWRSPPHPDRPAWHTSMAEAVQAHAEALAAELQPGPPNPPGGAAP